MADKRERDRIRAQEYRKGRRVDIERRAAERWMLVVDLVGVARSLFTDEAFLQIMLDNGVKSVPLQLLSGTNGWSEGKSDGSLPCTLDFVVAWKFLYPLFPNPSVSVFLERWRPGLILDFKDTFIGLVMFGPFPKERRVPELGGPLKA